MTVEIKNLEGALLYVHAGDALAGADLSRVKSLPRADFRNQDLRGINLEGVLCREADFSGSDMSGINTCLVYTQCQDAKFIGTNLRGANCERINLCGADLTGADARDIRSLAWKWDEKTKFPALM